MISSVQTLKKRLEMVNQIFANTLTSSSPRSRQPQHILHDLRPHQQAITKKMSDLERNLQEGNKIQNEILFSNHGYLGDPAGTGRTISVLSHISNSSTQTLRDILQETKPPVLKLHYTSSSTCFSLSEVNHPQEHLFDNLIVVSHTLFRQWQDSIQNNTTLNAFYIKSIRNLDEENLDELLRGCHLTLISNSLLHSFLNNLEARNIKPMWRRVFFDEADTIKIPSTCREVPALFTWFITGNCQNMLLSNECYHSYLLRQLPEEFIASLSAPLQEKIQEHIQNHPTALSFRMTSHNYFQRFVKNNHPLRGHLVISSSQAFLQESINPPQLHRDVIRCLTPSRHAIIEHAIPPEVAETLHAGDISGALLALGVSTHTPITLIEAVTTYAREQIQNNKSTLEEVLQDESISRDDPAVKKLQDDIQRLEEEVSTIERRLSTISTDDCAICFESPENRCITPCCSRTFCASCILEWMTRVPSCPLCRKTFHPTKLVMIGDEMNIREQITLTPRLPKKHEALVKLFRENPDGKFIVFSRFDNPFGLLSPRVIRNYNISFLQGNKDVIANTLSDFNNGVINILFVNNSSYIAGLNIPSATHIVLWHRMTEDLEKNIIGTAYCVGRQAPLSCITLLHERE